MTCARRCSLLLSISALFVLLVPGTASAHEFGPFAIDRYAAILASPDGLEIDYVLDLAETPTQADGDDIEADPVAFCTSLFDSVELTVDGDVPALDGPTATTLRQDGDGGLTTLRIECGWTAALGPAVTARSVTFEDDNYGERVGWREIIVVGDRTEVRGDVSDSSITERLTDFPDADDNPRTASVEFAFQASDDVGPQELDDTLPGEDDDGDAFSDLIADADGGIWSMIVALGFAAFLGALHSLAPGHGKSVIGAYLVGTKGTKLQALVLAIAVALSHTLGVLILGIITYLAGAAFAPERVYPWLQGISALIVLGIGIWLVITALRERAARRAGTTVAHEHGMHAHGHMHDEPTHSTGELHGLPSHSLLRAAGVTVAAGTAVAVEPDADGPETDAHHDHSHDHDHDLHSHDHDHHSHDHDHHSHDHDHHSHDHDHPSHDHDHPSHDHGHDHDHHSHGHDHDHSHDHDHDHSHDHGGGWHTHGIFPHTHKYDLDELDLSGKVSWKTLAVLGLSGGLVPSTAAIIVLLGAIQLNRIAFGGLLILSFGVGMAVALVSVGLGMVALRDRMFGSMGGNQIIATARRVIVPIAAFAVLAIGVFLVIRASVEIAGT